MTLAELERAINSKRRMEKIRAQERASFDYILADLIGRSFARTQHSANKMPSIQEAYPSLFSEEEIPEQVKEKQTEKKTELSVLRFKLFVDAHNKKFNKEATNN